MDHLSVQLVALGDHCESLKMELTLAGNRLSAMTRLVALLLSLMSKMSKEESRILQGVLCSQVDQQAGMQGWEERTEAAITQMLRTVLAKSPKEQNGTAASYSYRRSDFRWCYNKDNVIISSDLLLQCLFTLWRRWKIRRS